MIAVNDLDLTEHRYFFSSSTSGLPAVPPVMLSPENTFRMKPALSSSPGFGSTGPTMASSAILGPNMIRVMRFSLQGDMPPDSLLMGSEWFQPTIFSKFSGASGPCIADWRMGVELDILSS